LILVLVAWFNWRQIDGMHERAGWVRHTEKVREALASLSLDLQNIETGSRGYIITGDENYLGSFHDGSNKVEVHLHTIRGLTKDNPLQQSRCDLLEPILQDRVAAAKSAVDLRRNDGLEAARAEVIRGRGKSLMDEARTTISAMDMEEKRLLEYRLAEAQEETEQSRQLVLLGTGLSVLLLLGIFRIIFRENRMRLESENKLAQTNYELQTQARANRLIMKYSLDVICTIDGEGKFVFVSDAGERLWGYAPEELAGRKFIDLVHEDDMERTLAAAAAINSGTPMRNFENRYRRKDGSLIPVAWSASWSEEDQMTYCVAHDATEKQNAEIAIAELNAELTHRATQLEETNKELAAFSYSVSHDLRSPLRGIDGFSQALEEDYAEKLDDEGRNFLFRIRAAARRMGELIDDLLKLSKITRAEMRRVPVDLTALSKTIAADLERRDPKRQVQWEIADGLTAQGDPQLLCVALENLLSNAWKFTGKKTDALIQVASKEVDGANTFYVRDNGAGFDMTYSAKLFGAFQRLHTLAEFEGTGIGLATVQRIMHRHGGRAWAEGVLGEGAAVYFSI
jgi:PAS domain S-box-containing protein